jgi:uncharacterized oxidoreductase
MPVITARDLTAFAESLFVAAGASASDAEIVARSLVDANLRGHDSHGVMRIPLYIAKAQDGSLNAKGTLQVLHETPAVLVCDGEWGFGQPICHQIMHKLIAKAGVLGIACGSLRRSAHIGRLGEYAEMAAEVGMATIITANTHGAAPRVAPVGGKRPRLGTNPLCMGMPGGKEGPFILDFSTCATAEGKVRVKKIAGQPVPLGWILDPDGNPTTDPNQLYGDPPGTILPLGGDQAYKGFGLSYMIEILCGGLSGGPCAHPNPPPPMGNCATFIVLDPKHFSGTEHLLKEAAQLEAHVRGVPLIDGVERVYLPGDPERSTLSTRQASGIPLDAGNWNALLKLAAELKVAAPIQA